MKKGKNNIITSIALIMAILLMVLLPLPVAHAANFSVSKSNVSIEAGKTSTITINAPTHTGRLDINSSNLGIAIVNENNLWVENNSKTITISAKSAGTAIITISGELYDSSTETEEKFSKTVKVTVTKSVVSESINTSENNTSSGTVLGNSNNNNNQGSNVNTNTSKNQNTTSKPNSAITDKPNSTTSSKPVTSSKPMIQSSTIVESKPSNEISNITDINKVEDSEAVRESEEISTQSSNSIEENKEAVTKEEAIIEQEQVTAEINNMEETRIVQVNSKIIIITIIGIIAVAMIIVGIGVSKNILKK